MHIRRYDAALLKHRMKLAVEQSERLCAVTVREIRNNAYCLAALLHGAHHAAGKRDIVIHGYIPPSRDKPAHAGGDQTFLCDRYRYTAIPKRAKLHNVAVRAGFKRKVLCVAVKVGKLPDHRALRSSLRGARHGHGVHAHDAPPLSHAEVRHRAQSAIPAAAIIAFEIER